MMFRGFSCTLLVLFLGVTGCRSAFQPPPASFERWTRPGTSSHHIMASLMECGYPSPGPNIDEWNSAYGTIWRAPKLLAAKCMESQGYTEKFGEGSKSECRYYSFAETRKYLTGEQIEALERACAPGAPVPLPNVEKRLNSAYCKVKTYRDYPQCQQIVPQDSGSETRAASHPESVPEYRGPNELTQKVQKDNNEQMNKMRQSMQKNK